MKVTSEDKVTCLSTELYMQETKIDHFGFTWSSVELSSGNCNKKINFLRRTSVRLKLAQRAQVTTSHTLSPYIAFSQSNSKTDFLLKSVMLEDI